MSGKSGHRCVGTGVWTQQQGQLKSQDKGFSKETGEEGGLKPCLAVLAAAPGTPSGESFRKQVGLNKLRRETFVLNKTTKTTQ